MTFSSNNPQNDYFFDGELPKTKTRKKPKKTKNQKKTKKTKTTKCLHPSGPSHVHVCAPVRPKKAPPGLNRCQTNPQHPILAHFRPSGPSANYRYGHLESNALIGIEFGEFRQKLKNLKFQQNSIFRESMGAIWIDSMSFGMVSPLSMFFHFFSILVKLTIFDGNVNYFWGNK